MPFPMVPAPTIPMVWICFMSSCRSSPLDCHCDGIATAQTQGCDPSPRFAPDHFVNQSDENPCTTCSYGMAEGDCTAVDVDFFRRKPKLLNHSDRLHRKCFIEFEEIHAFRCPSGFDKELLNCLDGRHHYQCGFDTAYGMPDDSGQRCPSKLAGALR